MIKGFSLKATLALVVVAALMSMVFFAGQASARPSFARAAQPSGQSIVDIALADKNEFTVLVAAAQRAGLVELLSGNRQLTVFAPTDEAFVKFLDVSSTDEAIAAIEEEDQEFLAGILAYHVINGRRNSNSVLAAPSYRTLSGQQLTRGELRPAKLDISARNGVVHVVNEVLVPPQLRQ